MIQLADLFSVPEMGLLCNVTEYFLRNHIDYHPEILFRDVKVRDGICSIVRIVSIKMNIVDFLYFRILYKVVIL